MTKSKKKKRKCCGFEYKALYSSSPFPTVWFIFDEHVFILYVFFVFFYIIVVLQVSYHSHGQTLRASSPPNFSKSWTAVCTVCLHNRWMAQMLRLPKKKKKNHQIVCKRSAFRRTTRLNTCRDPHHYTHAHAHARLHTHTHMPRLGTNSGVICKPRSEKVKNKQ